MSRTWRWIALMCAAGLAIGACGSSYKGLSKAEFVKQAVAICTKSDAKLTKIGNSFTSSSTIQQLKDGYAHQIVPIVNDEVDHLRALKPPKADRKEVSKIFDDLSKGLEQAAAKIASLKSTKELATISEPPALKTANQEAKAYGLGKCADSST